MSFFHPFQSPECSRRTCRQRMKHYTGCMHDDLFGFRSTTAGEAVVHNVFFPLMPDEGTLGRTAQAVESLRARHVPQGRWLNPSRYHMTLHFLGTFSEL